MKTSDILSKSLERTQKCKYNDIRCEEIRQQISECFRDPENKSKT